MALDDSNIGKWHYKEHTLKKHDLLIKYFGSWLVILAKYNKKLCYFDCFAGRGQYKDGEYGSPIKILDTIRHRLRSSNFPKDRQIFCVFIEKDKDNFDNLSNIIEEYKKTHSKELKNVNIYLKNGAFSDVANKVLDDVKDNIIPSFFFIDPFGWKGISFETIRRIMQIKRCEVFINFMLEQVNRFFEDKKLFQSLDNLFGVEKSAEKILQLQEDLQISREDALLKFYRDQLLEVAGVNYTFPFQVCSTNQEKSKYYLIHATNHWRGAEVMKGIMYNEGTKGHFAYLGPAEGQMNLLDYSREDDLVKFLEEHYCGKKICFIDIIRENLNDKPYIEKNYKKALKELLENGKIKIDPIGPRGGFNLSAEITFH